MRTRIEVSGPENMRKHTTIVAYPIAILAVLAGRLAAADTTPDAKRPAAPKYGSVTACGLRYAKNCWQ